MRTLTPRHRQRRCRGNALARDVYAVHSKADLWDALCAVAAARLDPKLIERASASQQEDLLLFVVMDLLKESEGAQVEPPAPRDPRLDPRRNDAVACPDDTHRRVDWRQDDRVGITVTYRSRRHERVGLTVRKFTTSVAAWKRQTRDGTVEQQASE